MMGTVGHWTEEAYLPIKIEGNWIVENGRDMHIFVPVINSLTGKHYVYNLDTKTTIEKTSFAPQSMGYGCRIEGCIFFCGKKQTNTQLWIYDLATDAWATGPSSIKSNNLSSVVAHKGKVYALYQGSACFEFDPETNLWTELRPSLGAANAISIGDYIYLALVDRLRKYDPISQKFIDILYSGFTADSSSVAYYNGKIYIIGGYLPSSNGQREIHAYDLSSGSWSIAGYLPILGRSHTSAHFVDDILYVFGGGPNEVQQTVISTDQFSTNPETGEKIHIVLTSNSNADICISQGLDAGADYTWKSDDDSLAVMVEENPSQNPTGGASAVLGVEVKKP